MLSKDRQFLGVLAVTLSFLFGSKEAVASEFTLGGSISSGYLESSHYNYLADTEGGTFQFSEAAVNASWTPISRMTVNGQLFAFDLGPYGNFQLELDYLFLDYHFRREFGVRFGRVKREMGLYNHVQDIDVARTSILLPLGVYDHRYRDIGSSVDGGSVYGNLKFLDFGHLDYNLFFGYRQAEDNGAVAGFSITATSPFADDVHFVSLDPTRTYGGQVWWNTRLEGLRLGYSVSKFFTDGEMAGTVGASLGSPYAGYPMEIGIEGFLLDLNVLSAEYIVDDYTFTAEYLDSLVRSTSRFSVLEFPVGAYEWDAPSNGWYLSAARRFGKWELAYTYARHEIDISDPDGLLFLSEIEKYQKDNQISLRYDVSQNWTLKVEYHGMHGASRLFNQFGQNPAANQEAWNLWATKATFSF